MKKNIFIYIFISAVLTSALFTEEIPCQTVYGVTGSITTPSAYTAEFKEVLITSGVYKEKYFLRGVNYNMESFIYLDAVIGLLPGLEISLRVAGPPNVEKPMDSETPFYFTDRMISMKWNFLKEQELIPAVAIGIQDMIGQENFKKYNSLYLVTGKNLQVLNRTLNINIGFGTDLYDKIASKSREIRFKGVFGNADFNVLPGLNLQAEYDTRTINLGLEYTYKNLIRINTFFTDYKFPGASANLSLKF